MTLLHSNAAIASHLPRLAATGALAHSVAMSWAGISHADRRYPRSASKRTAFTV